MPRSNNDRRTKKLERTYNGDDLRTLKPCEAVREKPGMYIGGTDERTMHHCINEVLDNSVDEFLAGHCSHIDVTIHIDGSISITDNGRGIPVDFHADFECSILEAVFTKFYHPPATAQAKSPGMWCWCGTHSVGVVVVNAVSEWFEVETRRDGKIHSIVFTRGVTTRKLKTIDDPSDHPTRGTRITFKPDPLIFASTEFKIAQVRHLLLERAFFHASLTLTFLDERCGSGTERIRYQDGLPQFVEAPATTPAISEPIKIESKHGKILVSVILHFLDAKADEIRCYTNAQTNCRGGTHRLGLGVGLIRAMNQYARTNRLRKSWRIKLIDSDVIQGLAAVITLTHPDPSFDDTLKNFLISPEVEEIVATIVTEAVITHFEQNPKLAKHVIEKSLRAAQTRVASKRPR